MIRVAQDNFGVEIGDQIARENTFDCRLSAHGHENGSLDVAMGGVENARPCTGSGADGLKLESKHRSHCREKPRPMNTKASVLKNARKASFYLIELIDFIQETIK